MIRTTEARKIFLGALEAVEVEAAVRRQVSCERNRLTLGEETYDLEEFSSVVVIAVGKAATAMCEPVLQEIIPELQSQQSIRAVLVSPTPARVEEPSICFFKGNHPLPGSESFDAANEILRTLHSCDERSLVLFLLSGGASAMIEQPLDESITRAESFMLHEALVHSGLRIDQLNILRKHFSAVKGGRLALAAGKSRQFTLVVSDVPGSALDVVGSGPSLPDPSTVADCQLIVERNKDGLNLPDNVLAFFRSSQLQETPKPDHPVFRTARWRSLLSSDDLGGEAAKLALLAGFHVVIDNACDDWGYAEAADYLIRRVEGLRRHHPRVCLISVGELSVPVRGVPGRGGRNQHFVLDCALRLAGADPVTVLSGASDGVDGNSLAAGAICDETTVSRAAKLGIDPRAALEAFDSSSVFKVLGDDIVTGPTGNNLRDLRLLIVDAGAG